MVYRLNQSSAIGSFNSLVVLCMNSAKCLDVLAGPDEWHSVVTHVPHSIGHGTV